MTTYNNDRQRIKSYLFIGAALIAGTAIAAELTAPPEPSIKIIHAPAVFATDNPTEAFTLEQANATDKARQLTWSRCLLGQSFTDGACKGEPTEFTTWQEAIDAAQLQAKDGWRLPNIKELMSITESTQAFPAINTSVFPFATSFKFYTHEDTTETDNRAEWISRQTDLDDRSCTEDQWGRMVDKTGWACIHPKIPAKYARQMSSPYIWSATPAAEYSNNDNAKFAYTLNLAQGTPENNTQRDGQTVDYYGDPDPTGEAKARYVLLVKDMS